MEAPDRSDPSVGKALGFVRHGKKLASYNAFAISDESSPFYQLYNPAYPPILEGHLSEERWCEIIGNVNSIMQPLAEAHRTSFQGWFYKTIFAIPTLQRKLEQLEEYRDRLREEVAEYLHQENEKLRDTSVMFTEKKHRKRAPLGKIVVSILEPEQPRQFVEDEFVDESI